MNVTPLTLQSPGAVAATLRAHGWEPDQSVDAAGGLEPAAFHITGLDDDTRLELARYAGKIGLDLLSGDGWAILAGARSRIGALARPWMVPPELSALADQLGRALPADPDPFWVTARGAVPLDRPVIMAILNLTPDSFSDGGGLPNVAAALARAEQAVAEGAAILDVGGESTRPGRTWEVPPEEEIRRVLPVIEAIVRHLPGVHVSIDTVKAETGRAALDAGASIVNDVSGGRHDPRLLEEAARAKAGVVLMHSRGTLLELSSYEHARYGGDPMAALIDELGESLRTASAAGVAPDALVVDPGLGFAKTPAQSFTVLDRIGALRALGRPVMVGPSRKRFLGEATGAPVGERDGATATACALAYERGARIFRVHAVRPTREALAVAAALRRPDGDAA